MRLVNGRLSGAARARINTLKRTAIDQYSRRLSANYNPRQVRRQLGVFYDAQRAEASGQRVSVPASLPAGSQHIGFEGGVPLFRTPTGEVFEGPR